MTGQVTGLVARARARAAALMVDECVITRTSAGAFDSGTGEYATSTVTLYEGPCRLRTASAAGTTVTERVAGDAEQATTRSTVLVPAAVDTSIVEVGDVVEVTGRGTFTVVGRGESSTLTADSLLVERVEGPSTGVPASGSTLAAVNLDTGWRIWPTVTIIGDFTGQIGVEFEFRALQRRIGSTLWIGGLWRRITATVTGTGVLTYAADLPAELSDVWWPTNITRVAYTAQTIYTSSTASAAAWNLNFSPPAAPGFFAGVARVAAVGMAATAQAYYPAGTWNTFFTAVPYITDDPWPTVLPGTAYTP